MAQDLALDYTAGPSVTLLGGNLSDATTSSATSAVDFGAAPTPPEAGFELKLDCQTSSDALAYLHVVWSHDNSDYSDSSNKETIAVVDCTASTVAIKCGKFTLKARYCKFYLENQSGGTINSASTSLTLWDITGDQA